ncbi:Uncharacterised protein [Vibrio cholerae]|nr:Uncharacterised protein [Vibrio cholerae]
MKKFQILFTSDDSNADTNRTAVQELIKWLHHS